VSSNPVHGKEYSIQHYVMKFVSDLRHVGGFLLVLNTTLCDEVCQWLATCRWFSPGTQYNIMWWSLSVTCAMSVVFSWYSIQHYVMKFVSDLRHVSGFLLVLNTTLCDEVCQWLATCRWFSPGTQYNIMWWSLSVTCNMSEVFTRLFWFPPPIKVTSTI
jgi:hypothetical protein